MKMKRFTPMALMLCVAWFVIIKVTSASEQEPSPAASRQAGASTGSTQRRGILNGVFRLDSARGDKSYAVARSATSRLPADRQQRVFDDLLTRLSAPDLLVLEQRGRSITIASSRAPRFTFRADGIERVDRATDSSVSRTRGALEAVDGRDGERLVFTSSGGKSSDRFKITFEPSDDGGSLRVVRQIYAAGLDQPVTIENVFTKISEVARWDVSGQDAEAVETSTSSTASTNNPSTGNQPDDEIRTNVKATADAETLRRLLAEWIAATNENNIERQMTYYADTIAAYYLARNVRPAVVRAEKRRIFSGVSKIDIRAEEPEIIFTPDGRTAILRFRKEYRIERKAQRRQGAVVQELRWRRTGEGWKIYSERDIKVIR